MYSVENLSKSGKYGFCIDPQISRHVRKKKRLYVVASEDEWELYCWVCIAAITGHSHSVAFARRQWASEACGRGGADIDFCLPFH